MGLTDLDLDDDGGRWEPAPAWWEVVACGAMVALTVLVILLAR